MSSARKQTIDPADWVDRHGDVLYRYALLRVRSDVVAEELVQETFLAALQSSRGFAGNSSERTWLVGILKHKIVDHYRRTTRERPADELDGMPADDLQLFDANHYWIHEIGPVAWGPDPETALDRTRFWSVLEHCLGELPPRIATAFAMRELDELSSDEICKVLGVTTTNLWVMLHRARAHLRLCLEKSWVGRSAISGEAR